MKAKIKTSGDPMSTDHRTQHGKDVNSSQIDPYIESISYHNLSISFRYRQAYSRVYMERQMKELK
jgi:hypothetical protein